MTFRHFNHQVRGRGHEADGTHCQDLTAFASRAGVQVLVLADGAGSASHSEFGAQAVVHAGCELFIDRFEEFAASDDSTQARSEIIRSLLARLEVIAERRRCAVADLASTFLVVAVSGDRFVGAHVGDGVIGYVKNGTLRVASAPDTSEFANQTTFVTSSSAAASMRLFRGSLEGVDGFILMSDGAGESLFDHRQQKLAAACARLIDLLRNAPTRQVKHPRHERQLRRFVDTRVRGATKDDCSIGILARTPAATRYRGSPAPSA